MEESKFQFELPGYSRQDLLALNKLSVKKSKLYRWLTPLFRLICCLVGIFFLLTGVLLIYGSCTGFLRRWALAAFSIVLGFLWLYMGVFHFQRSAWRSRRLLLRDAGDIHVVFSEDGMVEDSKKGSGFYHYDAFVGAYDYCDRWFLFLDKRHAAILPRAAMTAGDPEAFGAFLEEKLGKPVLHITSRRKGAKT